jgi:hypothetical protein
MIKMLLSWLHNLPDWAVYLAVVPTITVTVAAMPLIGARMVGIRPNDERSRGAIEAFKAIVSSVAFLLAFSLVQAEGNLRSLEKLVSQEASALNTVDRTLLRYGSDDFLSLRASLPRLGRLIVSDEWGGMARGERSPDVEALVDTLSRRIRTTEAGTQRQQTLFGELVGKLDEFTDRREELIAAASSRLPPLFWGTILALFGVLVALSFLITPTRERVLTIGGITAATCLILSLVIITDAPFSGGSQVEPLPLTRVIRMMEARGRDLPVQASGLDKPAPRVP